MNIGVKIKKARNDKGMTLKELSEKSQLSVGFLSQLERGLTTIAVESLQMLSEVLDVPLRYFLSYQSKNNSEILRSYEREMINIEFGNEINYNLSADLESKGIVPRLVEILPKLSE